MDAANSPGAKGTSSGSQPSTAVSTNSRPGGMAQPGGTKTPRKVQWASNTKTSTNSLPHQLDEGGLNPSAFQELTTALEQHRSSPEERLNINTRDLDQNQPTHISTVSTPASSLPSTGPPSPVREVPGEPIIEATEKSGLPAALPTNETDDPDARARQHSERAASKLVKAHARGSHLLSGFGFGSRNPVKVKSKDNQTAFSTSMDVEKDGERRNLKSRPAQASGGVLSALLTLYDRPPSGSSTPSTAHSPSSSRSVSPAREDRGHRPRISITSNLKHLAGKLRDDRPVTARNAGGVFGSLIASAGNLSGAAAPVPSTIGPNPKRPGYHLSRYSMEEYPPPRIVGSRPGSRPQSIHSDNGTVEKTTPSPPAPSDLRLTSSLSDSLINADLNASHNKRKPFQGALKDLPPFARTWSWAGTESRSVGGTPESEYDDDKWSVNGNGNAAKLNSKRVEKKKKRKKAEIFITRHIAQIIQRQDFILKFARAFMMFGAPSHRLQSQIYSTARVLDVELSCMYLPDVLLISFEDAATSTTNIKFIRQGSALNLEKLQDAYDLYWKVIHDDISVADASLELDELMRSKPRYNSWQLVIIGGFCSAAICSVSFAGSFIDSVISFPLGAFLVFVQLLSVKNELYSNIFEMTIATLMSFLAAALASTGVFCYPAVASSSVVLILPGFLVLSGSLELASRNIVSGSVRLCYAVMYALFLGFGLAIGGSVYEEIAHKTVLGSTDYTCSSSHNINGPWWQKSPSGYWAFLTVPMYSFFLSLRQHAPWNRKELIITVAIACVGWVCNHFSALRFVNRSDISSAIGAFSVGLIANVYGRFFSGNAFIIMITGILFQLPSGLGNGGLLTFAQESNSNSSTSYLSGFQTALSLIEVAIGLTVGLGISLVVVHPIQSRRRAGGVFSL